MTDVVIWTLTRDRIEYTQRMIEALHANAGMPFRHYVFDNGSEDGTQEWLRDNRDLFEDIFYSVDNRGIGAAGNVILDRVAQPGGADYVIKLDNDGIVQTPDMLPQMISAFEGLSSRFAILSPRVEGIVNQPSRKRNITSNGLRVGITGHVGGLFLMAPGDVWTEYRFPTHLPKARGYDSHLCAHVGRQGGIVGYVEDLVVEHADGTVAQSLKYPEYWQRKRQEEK